MRDSSKRLFVLVGAAAVAAAAFFYLRGKQEKPDLIRPTEPGFIDGARDFFDDSVIAPIGGLFSGLKDAVSRGAGVAVDAPRGAAVAAIGHIKGLARGVPKMGKDIFGTILGTGVTAGAYGQKKVRSTVRGGTTIIGKTLKKLRRGTRSITTVGNTKAKAITRRVTKYPRAITKGGIKGIFSFMRSRQKDLSKVRGRVTKAATRVTRAPTKASRIVRTVTKTPVGLAGMGLSRIRNVATSGLSRASKTGTSIASRFRSLLRRKTTPVKKAVSSVSKSVRKSRSIVKVGPGYSGFAMSNIRSLLRRKRGR